MPSDGTRSALPPWQSQTHLEAPAQTAARRSELYGRAVWRGSMYAAIRKLRVKSPKVSYFAGTKPYADDTPVAKVGLIARADNDVGCGVGYYK